MSSNKTQLINHYNYNLIKNIRDLEEELQETYLRLEYVNDLIKDWTHECLNVLIKVRNFQKKNITTLNKEIKVSQSKLNII